MRHRAIVLCALAVIASVAGCSRPTTDPTTDWSFTAFDNFDPSQVSMLPSNTHQTAATPIPQTATVGR